MELVSPLRPFGEDDRGPGEQHGASDAGFHQNGNTHDDFALYQDLPVNRAAGTPPPQPARISMPTDVISAIASPAGGGGGPLLGQALSGHGQNLGPTPYEDMGNNTPDYLGGGGTDAFSESDDDMVGIDDLVMGSSASKPR